MDKAFGMHAGTGLCAAHEVDSALLKDAGADAAEDIIRAAALKDDGVDAGKFQQAAKHQARRTCADNDNIGAQFAPLSLP
jgi:hypothetical protein